MMAEIMMTAVSAPSPHARRKLSLCSHGWSCGWNAHDAPLSMPCTGCRLYEPLRGRFIFAPFRCDWFATQGTPTAVWDRLRISQRAVGFMNRSDMHLSIMWMWTFPLQQPRDRLRCVCVCVCVCVCARNVCACICVFSGWPCGNVKSCTHYKHTLGTMSQ